MKYQDVRPAVFIRRRNRFSAEVVLDGQTETVHVKNTGRCGELLLPGSEVWVSRSHNPQRKTAYDLITVRKDTGALFNIDSQAPNHVVLEWLKTQAWDELRPEYTWGTSRFDFYMRRGAQRFLMEVKGCTLERNGVGYFPDAPTERGAKHLRELTHAAREGYRTFLAFVIQTDGVTEVRPNRQTDPAFAAALDEAVRAGVTVLHLPCHAEADALTIITNSTL